MSRKQTMMMYRPNMFNLVNNKNFPELVKDQKTASTKVMDYSNLINQTDDLPAINKKNPVLPGWVNIKKENNKIVKTYGESVSMPAIISILNDKEHYVKTQENIARLDHNVLMSQNQHNNRYIHHTCLDYENSFNREDDEYFVEEIEVEEEEEEEEF